MNADHPPSSASATEPHASETTVSVPLYAIRGEYQRPDTTQTLREGLAEYYRVNPGLLDPASMDNDLAARYFHCHDTTHVFFGTHTGLLDEGVNDVFTMFGVDVVYREYIKGFFATNEAGTVASEYGTHSKMTILRSVLWTFRLLPRIRRTCRAMHEKWPWDPPPDALDRSLVALREAYGLEIWRPEEVLGLPQS